MKCALLILIIYLQVTASIHTYKTMFISAKDNYKLWIDGEEVDGLLYTDVWSYPDRVEIRNDNRLIAVEVRTTEEPSIAHGLIVQSHSGIFDTINNEKWRCKDTLEDVEKENWYKLDIIKPKEWPASVIYAQNSNFESPMNPWLGPVRLMRSNATWVGSATFIDSTCYCLMFLEPKVVIENDLKGSRKINTPLNKTSKMLNRKHHKLLHSNAKQGRKQRHKEVLNDFENMEKTFESRYKRNVTEEKSGGKMEFKKKKLLNDEFKNKLEHWFRGPISTKMGPKVEGADETTTELRKVTQTTVTEALSTTQPCFEYLQIDRTLYITAIGDYNLYLDGSLTNDPPHEDDIHLLDAVQVPASTHLIEVEADFAELDTKQKPGLLMYSTDGVFNSDDRWQCGKSLKTESDDEVVYVPGLNMQPAKQYSMENFVTNQSKEATNKQLFNITIEEIILNTTAKWIWTANQNTFNIHCELRLSNEENKSNIKMLNKKNADEKITQNPQTTNTTIINVQTTTSTTIQTTKPTLSLGKTQVIASSVNAGVGQPNLKRSVKNDMEKEEPSYKEKLFRNPDFEKNFYIAAHQDFAVYIDGTRINRIFDKPPTTPKDEVPTTFFILPTNVSLLAVHVVALESKKLPAFLSGDKAGFYNSDKRWRCTNGPYIDLDWYSMEYDDSSWSHVIVGASNKYQDADELLNTPGTRNSTFRNSTHAVEKRDVRSGVISNNGLDEQANGLELSQETQGQDSITKSTFNVIESQTDYLTTLTVKNNSNAKAEHVLVLRYSNEEKRDTDDTYEKSRSQSADDEDSDDEEDDDEEDDDEEDDDDDDYEVKTDDENDETEEKAMEAAAKRDPNHRLTTSMNSLSSSKKTTVQSLLQTENKAPAVTVNTQGELMSTSKEGLKREIVQDLAENSSINFGNMKAMPYSLYTTKYEFFNGTLLDYTLTDGNSTGLRKKKKKTNKRKYCKKKMKNTKYGFSRNIPKTAAWITASNGNFEKIDVVSEIFCRLKLNDNGKPEYGLKDSTKKKIEKIEEEFCEILSKF